MIVLSILFRAVRQLGMGVAVGSIVGALLLLGGSPMDGREAVRMLIGVSLLMTIVGLAATVGPARRSLRVQPTEALREV